jgi:glutamine amidotransferase
MIVVIDYDMGNVGSVINMLKKVGAEARLSQGPQDLWDAEKLVLPGVGAFDDGMANLARLGYLSALNRLVIAEKRPILGVCLGMQLLTRQSEEGKLPGLGWIAADTIRFRFPSEGSVLKIPHMGWNFVRPRAGSKFFPAESVDERFYFVHSYHVVCDQPEDMLATTEYGYEFTSAIQRKNIVGTQFHPEKSHRYGMAFYSRFAAWDGWSDGSFDAIQL